MNAVVVTRHVWTRTAVPRLLAAYARVGEEVETFTGHADADCPKARGAEIVARDVPLNERAAGWPCAACIPDVPGDRPQPFAGDGDASRFADGTPPVVVDPASPVRDGPAPSTCPGESRTLGPFPDGLRILDRVNQYRGRCPRCGDDVAANGGRLGKLDGEWVAVHRTCAEK